MPTGRKALRAEAYEKRRMTWEEKKKNFLQERRKQFGRSIKRFDAYGKPLADGDIPTEPIVWAEIARGLGLAPEATGDPIFSDALACLKDYGLDEGPPARSLIAARVSIFGDPEIGYLQNMKWLLDNESRFCVSERAAAEEVAAYYFYNAESFDAACEHLRKNFSAWRRAGYPSKPIAYESGYAGYQVRVNAVGQNAVELPGIRSPIAETGAVVRYTSYWRRRFRDGEISIAREA